MIPSVALYKRKNRLVVASYSETVSGYHVFNGSFGWLDEPNVDAEELGAMVIQYLTYCTSSVPDPDWSRESPFDTVLEAFGVSSHSSFMKGSLSVDVSDKGIVLEVTPTKNAGARGGFVQIPDSTETISDKTYGNIGKVVLDVFQRAQ